MFRHLMTLAALAASGLAAAAAPGPDPSDDTAAARAGVSALHVLDPRAYVQSELDWRSYYVNRFAAARAGDAAGRASPTTGSGS
ncbi:MAG: hypothetical protein QNJ91_05265 [Gammaproteobacteria bacterium]|nr:hypothetical protein [Gammaproteobacteria bacterium]